MRSRHRPVCGRLLSLALLAVMASASATALPGSAEAQSVAPPGVVPIARYVAEASRRFGVPEAWIWAVMRVESAGDVQAVSHAGAMGLMQLMPDTWASLRRRYGLGRNPYDPRDNVMAGAAYLREMHDRYGNSTAMLAAYNAGPGRYDTHLATGRPLPRETRAYLAILAPMVSGSQPDGGTIAVADPLAWTRASLFAMRAADTQVAPRSTADVQPDDEAAASETAPNAPPDRLFVPRSGRDPS